jgi:hypothetical protein
LTQGFGTVSQANLENEKKNQRGGLPLAQTWDGTGSLLSYKRHGSIVCPTRVLNKVRINLGKREERGTRIRPGDWRDGKWLRLYSDGS